MMFHKPGDGVRLVATLGDGHVFRALVLPDGFGKSDFAILSRADGSASQRSSSARVIWAFVIGSKPWIPTLTSPSAIAWTSRACKPQ